MPIHERARSTRSRWPVAFDIEGVPRDTETRNQKKEEIMQLSKGTDVGVFDFNNPPVKPYLFQEFPKTLYRAAERLVVKDKTAEEAAFAQGWQLKPGIVAKPAEPTVAEIAEMDQEAKFGGAVDIRARNAAEKKSKA